jgi:hypothetical protein
VKSTRRLQILEQIRRVDRSVVMTATVVMGSYRPLPEPPKFVSRAAKAAKTLKLRTTAKLYKYETLLERLPQDLQDMAAALGPFIQEEHAIMGQRPLARHRHVAPADQPCVRDGVVRSATRAGGDQGGAVAGEAGDAVDACGLNSLGEGHRQQDSGESPGQHRRACAWWTPHSDRITAGKYPVNCQCRCAWDRYNFTFHLVV